MGLDMYLYGSKTITPDHARFKELAALVAAEVEKYGEGSTAYISGWDHGPNEHFPMVRNVFGMDPDSGSPHFDLSTSGENLKISCAVAYWRKANQIHNWFVTEVQDGVDDCGEYPVHVEALAGLVGLCDRVLDAPVKASELPTVGGFFFGSTEVDEYYFEDLKYTVTRLKEVLGHPACQHAEFAYHSSW